MRKIKLEKIAGVVALSYLVLIPAGAFYVWRRVQEIDKDVNDLWVMNEMPKRTTPDNVITSGIGRLRSALRR